jgi:hypothetical protein
MSNNEMPRIIDYPTVLQRMTKLGYRSLYFNSGAFGFERGVETLSRGWIGPPDRSIRESARAIVRQASAPFALTMTTSMIDVWSKSVPGPLWLMPKSHWAYELDFGHRDWLPAVLQQIGIDPAALAGLNNAVAIEFTESDKSEFVYIVIELLNRLVTSDFQSVFLDHSTICTVHTRCQLWWTTTSARVIDRLDEALPGDGNSGPHIST